MFDFLDIRTLAFTNIILSFSLALGLMCYASTLTRFKIIFNVGFGILFFGGAGLLLSLRGKIDDFISIIIANELIIIGFILIYYGLHKLCQSSFDISKGLIVTLFIFIFIFIFILFLYYTYIDPSIKARIIIISYSISLICILCTHVLFTQKVKEYYLPTRILGIIFLFIAIIELIRSIVGSKISNELGFSDLSDIHVLVFCVSILHITSIGFCVVWIVNLKLQGELKALSELDYLTQINNRRSLECIAKKELSKAIRHKNPLSIIVCDIDHFKRINDQYGHQAGDDVLVNFSALIIKNLRDYDIVARYGGEEFLLLLPNTDIEEAIKVADKLRKIIKKNQFSISDNKTILVTASFGVTSNIESSNNWDIMVKVADNALYEAKRLGRNQVVR